MDKLLRKQSGAGIMTTQYTHRITLVAPEQYMDIANQLALIMGESPDDVNTFTQANWQDADGNLHSVCSAVSKPVVLGALTTGLPNPVPSHATAADVTKAQQALDLIVLYDVGVKASPEHIVLAIDYEPHKVFDAVGIFMVNGEELDDETITRNQE